MCWLYIQSLVISLIFCCHKINMVVTFCFTLFCVGMSLCHLLHDSCILWSITYHQKNWNLNRTLFHNFFFFFFGLAIWRGKIMRKWEVWSDSLQSEFGVSFTVTVVFTSREDIGVWMAIYLYYLDFFEVTKSLCITLVIKIIKRRGSRRSGNFKKNLI